MISFLNLITIREFGSLITIREFRSQHMLIPIIPLPNNNQRISAYANTHYILSTGVDSVATLTAISTYFSGSVGICTLSSTAGTLNALTLNAINSIQFNGTDISTTSATSNYALTYSTNNSNYTLNVNNILNYKFNLYRPIINAYNDQS